jgi:hypothetical protein
MTDTVDPRGPRGEVMSEERSPLEEPTDAQVVYKALTRAATRSLRDRNDAAAQGDPRSRDASRQ